MKSNLEKWNYYEGLLTARAEVFLDSINTIVPKLFYLVYPNGSVKECTVINRHYSFGLWYNKKVTNKDVEEIKSLYHSEIAFTENKAHFDYSYTYEYDGKSGIAKTAIKVKDVFGNKMAFLEKEAAEKRAFEICALNTEEKEFKALHKKDISHNYEANGYKFLGWQNSWHHVYFDEDGKQTTGDISKGEKPKRSFGYTKEHHPEYGNCMELSHRRIEVTRDNRGSENIVSCPTCKIYWKYDCSD